MSTNLDDGNAWNSWNVFTKKTDGIQLGAKKYSTLNNAPHEDDPSFALMQDVNRVTRVQIARISGITDPARLNDFERRFPIFAAERAKAGAFAGKPQTWQTAWASFAAREGLRGGE